MISICVIVKNDAVNLRHCLEKIQPLGYEIVIVDTGSNDETIEVAKSFTKNVYDFLWCNDFSAARNFAISKASNPYILMVDSDEFAVQFDKAEIEKLVRKHPNQVGRIHRNNPFERNGNSYIERELVNRLFAKEHFFYTGKIHEQITEKKENSYETYVVPIEFDHQGYNGTELERKQKADRNITLLKEMLAGQPSDTYVMYQLGKSYYFKGEYEVATTFFEQTFTYELDPNLEYVIDLIEMYGYSLLNSKQYEKALCLESLYEEFSSSADFVFLMGLIYQENGIFDRAVEEYLKATTYPDAKIEGVNGYLAFYNAGVILECLGMKEEAYHYYSKCGGYEKAVAGRERCR